MARSSSSMDDKIGGLQKAAILLITLGPEKSEIGRASCRERV